MTRICPEDIWYASDSELESFLNRGLADGREKKIRFYAPSFMYYRTSYFHSSGKEFPTISVTGQGCSLHCRHCDGKLLEAMLPAETPQMLYDQCNKLKAAGALGCLVSGGCLPDGSIPLRKFAGTIAKIKKDFGFTIIVHTGIVDTSTATSLRRAGVDAILIDIIGSDETIAQLCNLRVKVDDYDRSLRSLQESGVTFVPHIIAGLHYGRLKGELQALRLISRYKPSALVVIAFMPIRGTPMEEVDPPQPLDVARTLATARLMFLSTPLALGCMRPQGKHRAETDVLAVKSGVDAVAFPAEEAIVFAEQEGYKISFSPVCCSQVYKDLLS